MDIESWLPVPSRVSWRRSVHASEASSLLRRTADPLIRVDLFKLQLLQSLPYYCYFDLTSRPFLSVHGQTHVRAACLRATPQHKSIKPRLRITGAYPLLFGEGALNDPAGCNQFDCHLLDHWELYPLANYWVDHALGGGVLTCGVPWWSRQEPSAYWTLNSLATYQGNVSLQSHTIFRSWSL